MDANESTEADVYQEIMRDVYKQWLQEFDHEAAFRRNLPRREREWRLRSGLTRARSRARQRRAAKALTPPLADAQQCAP